MLAVEAPRGKSSILLPESSCSLSTGVEAAGEGTNGSPIGTCEGADAAGADGRREDGWSACCCVGGVGSGRLGREEREVREVRRDHLREVIMWRMCER